jgi:hypothetical protein
MIYFASQLTTDLLSTNEQHRLRVFEVILHDVVLILYLCMYPSSSSLLIFPFTIIKTRSDS